MMTRSHRKWAASLTGSVELALAFFVLCAIAGLSTAGVAMENPDMELEKLRKSTENATLDEPHLSSAQQVERKEQRNLNHSEAAFLTDAGLTKPLDSDLILASEASGRPPIYRSMPKQIDSLAGQSGGQQDKSVDKQLAQLSNELAVSLREQGDDSPQDLNTAAGHHKKKKHKKKKKKKIIIVKKKKKKKKKVKKHHEMKKKKKKVKKKKIKKKKHMKKKKKHHKKKKKKKKKVIIVKKKKKKKMMKKPSFQQHHYIPAYRQHKRHENSASHHHHEPSHQHHHQHKEASTPYGKYYEYRSVPKKGAWEFGFKRGNHKHMIERKEQGHKSHFKTTFNWKDKKGHGKHMFDYNHGDNKKHKYHAAAASHEVPNKLGAVAAQQPAGLHVPASN